MAFGRLTVKVKSPCSPHLVGAAEAEDETEVDV